VFWRYLLQKMNICVHQGTSALNAKQLWNGRCLVWNCGRLKCSLVLILTYIFCSRVIHYHLKFLTSDRFENRFITKYFREIDLQRAKHDQETVLPLTRTERRKYIMVIFTDIVNYCPAIAVVSKKAD
jgi:hypothetical protein